MSHLMPNPYGAAHVVPFDGVGLASGVRLAIERGSRDSYRNAQLDDYAGLPRSDFRNKPPLKLSLRARFSHEAPPAANGVQDAFGLQGTAGFGFWNDPFMMTDRRPPMLPRALWFFYGSPPSDMRLDVHTPGWGWKAATLDALRPEAIGPALAAPLLAPLMRSQRIYRRAWPAIQHRLRIAEALVRVPMTEWHHYSIEWGNDPEQRLARFLVDDQLVLVGPAPRGPLGLVIWCDNQYMVAQPWGKLAHGLLETPEQWLEVAEIRVQN